MNHKVCMTCVHTSTLFSDAPCNECNSNDEPVHARFWTAKSERETSDKWEPNAPAQSLIALGRRNGLEEALALVDSDCIAELRALVEANDTERARHNRDQSAHQRLGRLREDD